MHRFDATTASCFVYAYKAGALSAVGHDLKLGVEEFTVEFDDPPTRVMAEFRATSVRALCAREAGVDAPHKLSPANLEEIHEKVHEAVLDSGAHPLITLRSSQVTREGDGWRIPASLELRGKENVVGIRVRQDGGALICRAQFRQSDFGIVPFRAFMGALKVRDAVDVEVRVPFVPRG